MFTDDSGGGGNEAGTRLSGPERADLGRLEAAVEAGVRKYREAGEALAQIRSRRLYRETHATFEAYCDDRWGLSRPHAYRLIEAAAVAAEVVCLPLGDKAGGQAAGPAAPPLPPPATERQARKLAEAPPGQRRAVWQAGVDLSGGKAPSAARVEEILDKLRRGTPADPEELARAVRTREADVIARGDEEQGLTDAGDFEHRVGRARWHLKRARRLLEGVGPEGERAAGLIREADRAVVEDAGDRCVPPRAC